MDKRWDQPTIEQRRHRRTPDAHRSIQADVCVIGAGAAGISAALEADRLGRKAVLVDSQSTLGGQAVHSIIGTFCGLYSNGSRPYRVTYGVVDDLLRELHAADALRSRAGRNTLICQYDEVAYARWVDGKIANSSVLPICGAVLRRVHCDSRRLRAVEVATRFGDVTIEATGFVDASGDAVVSWLAGFEVQETTVPIYGTVMVTIEHVDVAAATALDRKEISERIVRYGAVYGLIRQDGFVFNFSGRDVALVNMTHLEAPLDPFAASRAVIEGRAQADRVLQFLQAEFPEAFGNARVRSYGQLGYRQTRTICGRETLTVSHVRSGEPFPDGVARCSWPIELHNDAAAAHWEVFDDDHIHYVPLRCMLPREADNLVAAGRCIDADPLALSSVRVMGPCFAMGAAASHALDLAGSGSLHQLDIGALRERISDNLVRCENLNEEGVAS